MRGQSAYFHSLTALSANRQHRTGVVVVHVLVVFFHKSLVSPFAKFTKLILVVNLVCLFLGNFDKLVPSLHFKSRCFFSRSTLGLRLDGSFIKGSGVVTASVFESVFNGFDDWRPEVLQRGL